MHPSPEVEPPGIGQTMPLTTPQRTTHRFDVVDSTNDEAKKLAAAGAAAGTIVRADRQTAGRGRYGRQWESPAGNLYLSYLFRPDVLVRKAAQIGYVAALSVAETVEILSGVSGRVTCKWPNDVLVDSRKVAGILAESSVAPDGALDWIVLGIGINLTHHPLDARWPSTDYQTAFQRAADPDFAVEVLTERLDSWMAAWLADGFGSIRKAWLDRAWSFGTDIQVMLQERTAVGQFVDLDSEGALILETVDGARETIHYGDVFPAEVR